MVPHGGGDEKRDLEWGSLRAAGRAKMTKGVLMTIRRGAGQRTVRYNRPEWLEAKIHLRDAFHAFKRSRDERRVDVHRKKGLETHGGSMAGNVRSMEGNPDKCEDRGASASGKNLVPTLL